MITRGRPDAAARTIRRLRALPERPSVVVVVNGDGTPPLEPDAGVRVVELDENLGAAGRDVGVAECTTDLVAFADDDSWWEPGSLACATDLFARSPRLGLLHARVVGRDGRDDPFCQVLASSPLERAADAPGVPILGFMACAVVVRREAFESAGGFGVAGFTGVGGEEARLALDLVSGGWDLRYVDDLVAHHHPDHRRDTAPRRQGGALHADLLTTWLRLPVPLALRRSAHLVRQVPPRTAARSVVRSALAWPRVRRHRRVAAPQAVREARLLHDHR